MLFVEPDEVTNFYFRRDVGLLYVSTSDGGVFAYKNVLEIEYKLLCAGNLCVIGEFLKSKSSPVVVLEPVLLVGQ